MIVENHQIAHRNVASKLYRFVPEEMNLAISDFDHILTESGYHPDGRMFFSIISDPTDEVMIVEVFLPVEESQFHLNSDEDVSYHSYFSINHMIMTRITDDFGEQSQVKYWELMDYLKIHHMIQKTPVFVEYKSSHAGQIYVELSVGFE